MISRNFCNYESMNFSRNRVFVYLILFNVNMYVTTIIFVEKTCRFVVTEFVKRSDEVDRRFVFEKILENMS